MIKKVDAGNDALSVGAHSIGLSAKTQIEVRDFFNFAQSDHYTNKALSAMSPS
jgi:hypothetical protein